MYLLWWKVGFERYTSFNHKLLTLYQKPKNISQPVVRNPSDRLDVLAVELVLANDEDKDLLYYCPGTLDALRQTQEALEEYQEENYQSQKVIIMDKTSALCQTIQSPRKGEEDVCTLVQGQALQCMIGPSQGLVYLSAKDVQRWNFLARYLRQCGLSKSVNGLVRQEKHITTIKFDHCVKISDLLSSHMNSFHFGRQSQLSHQMNFSYDVSYLIDIPSATDFELIIFLFVFLSLAYGGIHLAAWNFQFPSVTEQLVWKIACIIIMTTTATAMLSIPYFESNSLTFERWMITLLVLSILARTYLVVESFISLRHVPIGVFAALPWVQNIPHI